MKMTIKIQFFLLFLLGFSSNGFGLNAESHSSKPNILVIVVDDLGYSDLSFLPYASADVSTPNIDQIAKNGVFFSNAYASAPICSPARAGLITGRYQARWGNYWFNEGGLPASEVTLPQVLKRQGYFNVKIGKTHMNGGPVEHPLDHGFDYFLGFLDHTWDYLRLSQDDVTAYGDNNAKLAHIGPLLEGREKKSYKNSFTTDIFSEKAVEMIQSNSDKPWYIELEYNAVHQPTYVCHPDYLKKYGLKQFPFWDPSVEPYRAWHKKWGVLGNVDPDGRTRYLLQLEVLDNGIGKILEALKSTGQLDNTMVVFLSDNGGTNESYAMNQPLNGFKYMFGEGGIRIPMIIAYKGKVPQNKTVSQMVSALDIFPTVVEAAHGTNPKNLDGKSLWPVIENGDEGHTLLFWGDGHDQWVVRKNNWKLVHNIGYMHTNFKLEDGVAKSTKPYEYPNGILLFNLTKDIGETTNLAQKYPSIVTELTADYNRWRSKMSDPRTSTGELKTKKKN